MNRSLLVHLLKKNIDELILLTEGFNEMTTYPQALINLAKNKTDDIRHYLDDLGNLHEDTLATSTPEEFPTPAAPTDDADVDAEATATPAKEVAEVVTEEVSGVVSEVVPEVVSEVENVASTPAEIIPEDEDEDIIFDEDEDEDEDKITDEIQESEEEEEEEKITIKIEEEESTTGILTTADNEVVVADEVQQNEKTVTTSISTESVIVVQEEKTVTVKQMTLADRMTQQSVSRNDAHAKPQNGGMHAAMSGKKVEDIRQAISLGDRFRFQRELFRNNGEEMNKMLGYINQLATYDEVISFLQSKYGWSPDNITAEDFYQIIKRKFL